MGLARITLTFRGTAWGLRSIAQASISRLNPWCCRVPSSMAAAPDYSRQLLLKEIGPEGQAKLAKSRVLIVGAGGLGSPVLQYLAGAGVGHLRVGDSDPLGASNLHRQPIYALAAVGKSKVELARAAVAAINPSLAPESRDTRFTADNALGWVL